MTPVELEPIIEVDKEMTRRFLKGILKLKSIDLLPKNRKRLLLLRRLPTFQMEIERKCRLRVESWLRRTKNEIPKIAAHVSQLIEDIGTLQHDNPLRKALEQVKCGVTDADLKARQWRELEQENVGSDTATSRNIRKELHIGHKTTHVLSWFLRNPNLVPPEKSNDALVRLPISTPL